MSGFDIRLMWFEILFFLENDVESERLSQRQNTSLSIYVPLLYYAVYIVGIDIW